MVIYAHSRSGLVWGLLLGVVTMG